MEMTKEKFLTEVSNTIMNCYISYMAELNEEKTDFANLDFEEIYKKAAETCLEIYSNEREQGICVINSSWYKVIDKYEVSFDLYDPALIDEVKKITVAKVAEGFQPDAWQLELVRKVLRSKNFKIYEDEGLDRIFFNYKNENYTLRTWNFYDNGRVEWTLFKDVDNHGERVKDGYSWIKEDEG